MVTLTPTQQFNTHYGISGQGHVYQARSAITDFANVDAQAEQTLTLATSQANLVFAQAMIIAESAHETNTAADDLAFTIAATGFADIFVGEVVTAAAAQATAELAAFQTAITPVLASAQAAVTAWEASQGTHFAALVLAQVSAGITNITSQMGDQQSFATTVIGATSAKIIATQAADSAKANTEIGAVSGWINSVVPALASQIVTEAGAADAFNQSEAGFWQSFRDGQTTLFGNWSAATRNAAVTQAHDLTTATFDLITAQANAGKLADDEMIAAEKSASTNLIGKNKAFQEAIRDVAKIKAMLFAGAAQDKSNDLGRAQFSVSNTTDRRSCTFEATINDFAWNADYSPFSEPELEPNPFASMPSC